MSDTFTPQVSALLDRLEPPALSADFADRLVAKTQARPSLPPLPPRREPRLHRRGRRVALAVGVAGLVSMAAAAAVVPADVWRNLPVIGGIVEMISPARDAPLPAPPRIDPAPAPAGGTEPIPESIPVPPQPESKPLSKVEAAPSAVETRQEPPRVEAAPPAVQSESAERLREPLILPVRESLTPERPALVPAREESATVSDRRLERIVPPDTSETRQQIRERTIIRQPIPREPIERREIRPPSAQRTR